MIIINLIYIDWSREKKVYVDEFGETLAIYKKKDKEAMALQDILKNFTDIKPVTKKKS